MFCNRTVKIGLSPPPKGFGTMLILTQNPISDVVDTIQAACGRSIPFGEEGEI